MLTAIAAAVAPQFPCVQDEIEDLLAQLVISDPILRHIPFVDPDDTYSVNPVWTVHVYELLDERRPELATSFVDWYAAEEAAANREQRVPCLPWHRPLRYPLLHVQRNGQIDIHVD